MTREMSVTVTVDKEGKLRVQCDSETNPLEALTMLDQAFKSVESKIQGTARLIVPGGKG